MQCSYTVFVNDLQQRTICLSATPSLTLGDLKIEIQERTGIPCEQQLLSARNALSEDANLANLGINANSTLFLTGRLRGGKGGFGSLLRGSGKAALTENEDACRDLSGRRLRLVNADKKLQDWAASEKQRREEKLAARAEKDRAKAEYRAEAVQEHLQTIRKDQDAVVSSVAKALQSSFKNGQKRPASAVPKPVPKKTRYDSDLSASESDSEDELDNEISDNQAIIDPKQSEISDSSSQEAAKPTTQILTGGSEPATLDESNIVAAKLVVT